MKDDFLRDLVEGERAALVPSAGAKDQTWKRVARSVAIAAPVPAAAAPATAVPSATGWGAKAWWATWWVQSFALFAVGGAVVAGVLASGSETEIVGAAPAAVADPDPTASRAGDVSSPPTQRAETQTETETDQAVAAEATVADPATPLSSDSPAGAPSRAVRPRASTPSHDDAGDDAPADSALAEEARLVVAARRDLRNGDPRGALASLEDHARRFPRGQLTEERIALTARALCDAGDTEQGRRRAADLRAAFPSSSHLRRVDRACE